MIAHRRTTFNQLTFHFHLHSIEKHISLFLIILFIHHTEVVLMIINVRTSLFNFVSFLLVYVKCELFSGMIRYSSCEFLNESAIV